MRNEVIILALLFFFCYGLEYEYEAGQQTVFSVLKKPLRVAIVGGGAAGSSTAYFLRKEFNKRRRESSDDLEIIIFEASGRIGGRAEMQEIEFVDCNSASSCAEIRLGVEIGASLISEANLHLVNATKEFNLTAADFTESKRLGIWNGSKLVFNQDLSTAFGKAQFLWRYSAFSGPTYVQKITNQLAE
jgi:prenylcysteine oxidase/farnesylcysteine lyase